MIREKEVLNVLGEEFPDIRIELDMNNENMINVFQWFTSYTKKCFDTGNINKLKSCFLIAEKFLKKGNNSVKSAVENVFVNSISSLIEIVSPLRETVKNMLPKTLKKAYLKHMADTNYHNDWKDENCLFPDEIIDLQNNYYPG